MNPRIIPVVLVTLFTPAAMFVAGCSSSSGPAGLVEESPRERIKAMEGTHVVVVIAANNRVKLNGSRVTPEELPAELAALGKKQPGRPVALLLQWGVNPDAETFVRTHAAKAGLGAVELIELR